jgi:hypothetical protein
MLYNTIFFPFAFLFSLLKSFASLLSLPLCVKLPVELFMDLGREVELDVRVVGALGVQVPL